MDEEGEVTEQPDGYSEASDDRGDGPASPMMSGQIMAASEGSPKPTGSNASEDEAATIQVASTLVEPSEELPAKVHVFTTTLDDSRSKETVGLSASELNGPCLESSIVAPVEPSVATSKESTDTTLECTETLPADSADSRPNEMVDALPSTGEMPSATANEALLPDRMSTAVGEQQAEIDGRGMQSTEMSRNPILETNTCRHSRTPRQFYDITLQELLQQNEADKDGSPNTRRLCRGCASSMLSYVAVMHDLLNSMAADIVHKYGDENSCTLCLKETLSEKLRGPSAPGGMPSRLEGRTDNETETHFRNEFSRTGDASGSREAWPPCPYRHSIDDARDPQHAPVSTKAPTVSGRTRQERDLRDLAERLHVGNGRDLAGSPAEIGRVSPNKGTRGHPVGYGRDLAGSPAEMGDRDSRPITGVPTRPGVAHDPVSVGDEDYLDARETVPKSSGVTHENGPLNFQNGPAYSNKNDVGIGSSFSIDGGVGPQVPDTNRGYRRRHLQTLPSYRESADITSRESAEPTVLRVCDASAEPTVLRVCDASAEPRSRDREREERALHARGESEPHSLPAQPPAVSASEENSRILQRTKSWDQIADYVDEWLATPREPAAAEEAFVTLANSNVEGLACLVLGHSLLRAHTTRTLTVLTTDGVSAPIRHLLGSVFHIVQSVKSLDSHGTTNLALLDEPELGVSFVKLHVWQLVQFSKCVFLDSSTLVLQNCDELFEREELSAVPDIGWPDCFNAGVFVYRPSLETFSNLIRFAEDHGSFDGGDQGLLNMYFSNWLTDITHKLPFIYNLMANVSYTYTPAFRQFGKDVKIVHFFGSYKPWHVKFHVATGQMAPSANVHPTFARFVQLWLEICAERIVPVLSVRVVTGSYMCPRDLLQEFPQPASDERTEGLPTAPSFRRNVKIPVPGELSDGRVSEERPVEDPVRSILPEDTDKRDDFVVPEQILATTETELGTEEEAEPLVVPDAETESEEPETTEENETGIPGSEMGDYQGMAMWERGMMDYMGQHSSDKILRRLDFLMNNVDNRDS